MSWDAWNAGRSLRSAGSTFSPTPIPGGAGTKPPGRPPASVPSIPQTPKPPRYPPFSPHVIPNTAYDRALRVLREIANKAGWATFRGMRYGDPRVYAIIGTVYPSIKSWIPYPWYPPTDTLALPANWVVCKVCPQEPQYQNQGSSGWAPGSVGANGFACNASSYCTSGCLGGQTISPVSGIGTTLACNVNSVLWVEHTHDVGPGSPRYAHALALAKQNNMQVNCSAGSQLCTGTPALARNPAIYRPFIDVVPEIPGYDIDYDPARIPPNLPMPQPHRPVPVRTLPRRPDPTWRPARERSETGPKPSPKPETPSPGVPVVVPGVDTAIVIDVRPPPRVPELPSPRPRWEREKKTIARSVIKLLRGISNATETIDFMECLASAAPGGPPQTRVIKGNRVVNPRRESFNSRMSRAISAAVTGDYDVEKLMICLANNEVQDAIIGRGGQALGKESRKSGRPVGYQTGSRNWYSSRAFQEGPRIIRG